MSASKAKVKLACFDIDGTVMACDSFRQKLFCTFYHSPWRIILAIIIFPVICIKRRELGSRSAVKSAFIWALTFGRSPAGLKQLFLKGKFSIPALCEPCLYKEIRSELNRLRREGHHICYVSASADAWLKGVIALFDDGDYTLISTRLKTWARGLIIDGRNCYGSEKVRRIHNQWPHAVELTAGYTDSISDSAFLALCKKKYLINPDQKVAAYYAQKNINVTRLRWSA
ncbi:MAG TPA: haloacid dehalogenase-like hydrolase [Spirochaetota bacterium]|nr:haloacid dehalogenase-like hydrolase [Spirochaetota bacterium]